MANEAAKPEPIPHRAEHGDGASSTLSGGIAEPVSMAIPEAKPEPIPHCGEHGDDFSGNTPVAGGTDAGAFVVVEPTAAASAATVLAQQQQLQAPLFEATAYNAAIPPEFVDDDGDYFECDFFADEVVDAPLELAQLDPYFGRGLKHGDGSIAFVDSFVIGCLSGTKLYRVQPITGGDSFYMSANEILRAQVELTELQRTTATAMATSRTT